MKRWAFWLVLVTTAILFLATLINAPWTAAWGNEHSTRWSGLWDPPPGFRSDPRLRLDVLVVEWLALAVFAGPLLWFLRPRRAAVPAASSVQTPPTPPPGHPLGL